MSDQNKVALSANLRQLSVLSRDAVENGSSHADVLLAVGDDLPDYDGLKVFCFVNGMMMRPFGAWPLVLLEAVAIVGLLVVVAKETDDLFEWLNKKFGGVVTLIAAVAGAGGLGLLGYRMLKGDERPKDAISLSTSALKGFIIGLFPGPFQSALMAVAVEQGGMFGIGPGGGGGGVISTVKRAVGLDEEEPDGEEDGELDDATIGSMADAMGVSKDEVYDMIARS
jgi:hypothetical protein